MLEDLPDIEEIESQANHMYSQNSIIPNDMYNKFKGNLRAVREIPNEAGMNTVKYMGNYTPVPANQPMLNSTFPMTQVPQQITLPLHTTQLTQNQVPTYYVFSQPVNSAQPVIQESFTTTSRQIEKPQMAEITMSTERFESQKCDCTSTLKGYLVAIIILLIIFILLLLYFLRVLNNK